MKELFPYINDNVKDAAKMIWNLALSYSNPEKSAHVLIKMTDYFKNFFNRDEIEFLQFYFNTQMEMMKK